MTPEQYQQVKQLFSAALELSALQRSAFLAEQCAGNAELQAEVESLLKSHEAAEEFIETPALAINATLAAGIPTVSDLGGQDNHRSLPASKRVGAYEIVRELGEGGMGVVYLAVRADDQFKQHVAIKLIRQGFASDFLVRRFRHERQILASLNHPNIARLFDGGTTEDGRPYLVMEYIEGEPIDVYCDRHQLPLNDRLRLFLQVCAAVQFAHQNLIVHRDLKPGNILVTADGTPKLLDFGIAKLLQDEALPETNPDATLTGMRLMTPGYASPEQVRAESITTASDVYSLGCILYELLTGHRPYHVSSLPPQQIIQVICEAQPTRPSAMVLRTEAITRGRGTVDMLITPEQVSKARTDQPQKLQQKLFGDLDNIVLYALRKEPSLRYASARELAEDLTRHLSGHPVLARPQTWMYRASRFIQRNSIAVVAALLLALTLIGGLGATLWQARVAQRERAKAEQRFNDVRQLAHAVVFEMHDAIQNLPGSTPARALLVKRALEYLDNLSREAGADRSLQEEMAAAYEKIAQVQGDPYRANLGDLDGALQSYQKALALREALVRDNAKDAAARLALAECLDKLGWIVGTREGPKKESAFHLRAQDLLAELMKTNGQEEKTRAVFARNLESIGQIHFAEGEYDKALERYRQSSELVAALSQQSTLPDDQFKYRRAIAIGKLNAASVYSAQRQWPQAIETAREGIKLAETLATENPTNALAQRDLTAHLNHMGDVLWYSGNRKAALEHYQRALEERRKLAAADPQNAQLKRDVALCLGNAGYVLAEQGDAHSAQAYYQEAFRIFEALLAANPESAKEKQDLMKQQAFYGDVNKILASQPNVSPSQRVTYWQTARDSYQRSLEMWLALVQKGVAQGNDAGQEKKLRDEIEKCDQVLAKLR